MSSFTVRISGWYAWLGTAVCSGFAVVAGYHGRIGTMLLFVPWVVLCILSLLWGGHITVDELGVTHRNAFGRFRMRWNNIREIDFGAGTIVLRGDNCRFVLPASGLWAGREKREANTLLTRKLGATGITPMPSSSAELKLHKNVRVATTSEPDAECDSSPGS